MLNKLIQLYCLTLTKTEYKQLNMDSMRKKTNPVVTSDTGKKCLTPFKQHSVLSTKTSEKSSIGFKQLKLRPVLDQHLCYQRVLNGFYHRICLNSVCLDRCPYSKMNEYHIFSFNKGKTMFGYKTTPPEKLKTHRHVVLKC